jgi:adenylate cyclase
MRPRHLLVIARIVVVLLLSTITAWVLTRPPFPLAAAQHLVDGAAFRILAPVSSAPAEVVVIGVTEDTLAAFPYRSPIDRGFLAKLIDQLARDGVRAVGLDVLLDRPTEPAKDSALHAALTRTDIPVVAISVAPDTTMPPQQRAFLTQFLQGVRTGDANLVRDRFDDVVRTHVPRNLQTGQPSFPTALAEALGVAAPERPFPIVWHRAAGGGDLLNVPTYPANAIALLPPGWLKGKVAVIGSLIPGTDEHRTLASTFGRPSFGVKIHAQVLSQILEHRAIAAPAVPIMIIIATIGLAGIGVLFGTIWAGFLGVAAITLTGVLFVAAALIAYSLSGVMVPIVAPVAALAMAGGGARAISGLTERRDRRALRTLFSRFVSSPVVDQIMRERDLFMAGGRPRPRELTATVLFADIAGFTTICERMSPEPLIAWLDQYIDTMAALIDKHDGVLLRFIGDGILAVFGAPVARETEADVTADARNAARCALAMEQAMAALNDGWAAQGLPVGGLRVGLHTGPMVAGSLGTGARMEFCLLGDTANTGARLEQLGKDFADSDPRYCTIVIGEPTWRRLGAAFSGLYLGDFALRGRHARLDAWRIDSKAAAQAVANTNVTTSRRQPIPATDHGQ